PLSYKRQQRKCNGKSNVEREQHLMQRRKTLLPPGTVFTGDSSSSRASSEVPPRLLTSSEEEGRHSQTASRLARIRTNLQEVQGKAVPTRFRSSCLAA